jgi:hypothetical protein
MTKTTNKNNVKNFVDPYHGEIELDDEELHSYPSSSHISNTNSYPVNGMARRVPHHHDHDRPRHDRNDDHQHHYHSYAGPFAVKLHDIVSDESIGFIQWLPCGKAFMITNKDKLAKLVLPIYFGAKLNQFSSFIWNLSRWQFKLIPPKRGERFRTYYHEQFIRGHRALSYSIKSNYLEQRRATPASYATANNRQHPREHPTSNTTDFDVPPVVPTRYKTVEMI